MKLLENFLNEDYFDNIALFEYHDEPLALSSTFENKVPYSIINKRFNIIKKQVNKLLSNRNKNRKNQKEIWYIESITQNTNWISLSIRPEINCPEIDPIDKVKLENVVQIFDADEITIWSKVEYIV